MFLKSKISFLTLFLTFGFINSAISNINEVDDYYFEEDQTCMSSVLPPNPSSGCCGIDSSSSNRVVGGAPTLLKQYPWLALIEYKMKESKKLGTRCGGALISGLYVLTAAHCVSGDILEESSVYAVILGEYDKYHKGPDCIISNGIRQCTEGAKRIYIHKIIPHQKYNEIDMTYDIALLKMKTMVVFTDAIRPICLPSLDMNLFKNKQNIWFYVAGWGTMKQRKVGKEYKDTTSRVKRHLAVPYVSLEKCSEPWGVLTADQICAGGKKGQDTCMGDSGGPLMFENDGLYEVSGVVSFGAGDPCGQANIPGVYTNVYHYKEWIYHNIVKK